MLLNSEQVANITKVMQVNMGHQVMLANQVTKFIQVQCPGPSGLACKSL